MPIKIIADYRELLIDIFFAIIIAVGFDRFIRDFLLEHIQEISPPLAILDISFFFAAYFWVITHWVSYHELITKYPYYRWRKFFVDISLFSTMFIIINISFLVDRYEISLLLVWLLIIWYSLACMWHVSDWKLRPLRLYLELHSLRIITFVILLLLLYPPLGILLPTFVLFVTEITDVLSIPVMIAIFPSYRYGVMIAVILAMILWNVQRLIRFTSKDSRIYRCSYISGYPRRNTTIEGQLELIRYPLMKELRGDTKKDRIRFESDDSPKTEIEIFAEDLTEVKLVRAHRQPNVTDLRLQIDCKFWRDGIGENIRILFELDDEIITNVKEATKELLERNNHGNSSPL
jgi:hypothetical protein